MNTNAARLGKSGLLRDQKETENEQSRFHFNPVNINV
jgi:hypothetical protein